MKKYILFAFTALVSLVSLTSCDDKASISFVTWKGFTVEPTTLSAGDTLIIKAHVDKPGKNLYKVNYSWTLEVDTLSADGTKSGKQKLTYNIASTAGHPIHMNDQPVAYFKMPANIVKGTASHNVSFQVNYDNAMDSEPMNFTTHVKDGYLGTEISYNVLSILYSQAKSNFRCTFTVE